VDRRVRADRSAHGALKTQPRTRDEIAHRSDTRVFRMIPCSLVGRYSKNGRSRRVAPVSARSGDRLLSEPTADTQPCRREPLFMPEAAVLRPRAKRLRRVGKRSIVALPLVGGMLFQPFTAASAKSAAGGRQRVKICRACVRSQSARQQHGTPVLSAFLFP
jgi:hypothetical protein